MKTYLRPLLFLIAGIVLPAKASTIFNKLPGMDAAQINRVLICNNTPPTIIATSPNTLYRSNEESSFQKLMVLKDEEMSHLCRQSTTNQTLYLAATRNAYQVNATTKRIFSANEGETINHITPHGNKIYIGTSQRLVFADTNLLDWKTVPALSDTAIYSMTSKNDQLYLATEEGVYRLNLDGAFERIFATRRNGDTTSLRAHCIKIDLRSPEKIWICTNKGLYESDDSGASWQRLFITGLGNATINYMDQSPNQPENLFLCTDAGFFKLNTDTGSSEHLYEGLPTPDIRWMDIDIENTIYLSTAQGLFKSSTKPPKGTTGVQNMDNLLAGEPSIHQVQNAALRYNSVHPEKTKAWRDRLKYRALLPKLSVDFDKTIGSSFTQSGHYYASGPNDWGISLTWDMGDLIWNSYEDDVDNRTKLTTQLRMDILDEVNRLYYERLRLKHAIIQTAPSDETFFTQVLRFAELTSTLDGYTGGLFSNP